MTDQTCFYKKRLSMHKALSLIPNTGVGKKALRNSNESKGNEAQTLERNPTVKRADGLCFCVLA